MFNRFTSTFACASLSIVVSLHAQEPSLKQIAQERAQAELDAPKLADVLELKPGMTVADIGAGGGAMTVVLGRWVESGRVFATDIEPRHLASIRDYATREGLRNVTVIEGAAASTNLPTACCDAIFLRHVYHHITGVEAFNKSLVGSPSCWRQHRDTCRVIGHLRECPAETGHYRQVAARAGLNHYVTEMTIRLTAFAKATAKKPATVYCAHDGGPQPAFTG